MLPVVVLIYCDWHFPLHIRTGSYGDTIVWRLGSIFLVLDSHTEDSKLCIIFHTYRRLVSHHSLKYKAGGVFVVLIIMAVTGQYQASRANMLNSYLGKSSWHRTCY